MSDFLTHRYHVDFVNNNATRLRQGFLSQGRNSKSKLTLQSLSTWQANAATRENGHGLHDLVEVFSRFTVTVASCIGAIGLCGGKVGLCTGKVGLQTGTVGLCAGKVCLRTDAFCLCGGFPTSPATRPGQDLDRRGRVTWQRKDQRCQALALCNQVRRLRPSSHRAKEECSRAAASSKKQDDHIKKLNWKFHKIERLPCFWLLRQNLSLDLKVKKRVLDDKVCRHGERW